MSVFGHFLFFADHPCSGVLQDTSQILAMVAQDPLYSLVITLDGLLYTVCLIMPWAWDALATAVWTGLLNFSSSSTTIPKSLPSAKQKSINCLEPSPPIIWYCHLMFFLPKCIDLHFWMLNSSFHSQAHSEIKFRSSFMEALVTDWLCRANKL